MHFEQAKFRVLQVSASWDAADSQVDTIILDLELVSSGVGAIPQNI